jgi:hypothetical protein
MRKTVFLVAVGAVLAGAATAQEPPKAPAPQKEHAWLKQLEGEWEIESEAILEPGKPPVRSKGTESVRTLGGFWTVAEMKLDCLGVPVTGVMTVGYDATKKKYVGTWVCSMSDWLCHYEGTADGKVLKLECEGPNPADPARRIKMRDVIEIKGKDLKVLTSSALGEDGKWVPFMTMTFRRKK